MARWGVVALTTLTFAVTACDKKEDSAKKEGEDKKDGAAKDEPK